MKKLVEIQECEGAFEQLLGKTVTLFCGCYFYNGKLIGINDENVCLKDAAVIYETGSYSNAEWKDKQSMCVEELFVQKAAIEAFAETK